MSNTSLEVEAANSGLLAPSATDLMCLVENGEIDEAAERVQTLGREDYVAVLRVVRQLDEMLSAYAASWQNAQYWGNGQAFPGDEKAKAASA